MVECNKCKRCFRDNYRLNRHLSRLVPCDLKNKNKNLPFCADSVPNLPDQSLDAPIQSSNLQIQSLDAPIQSPFGANESSHKCEFCLNVFYNKFTKNRHSVICKHRDDPIRLLEIQNKVKPKEPSSKYGCRFCDNEFHNSSNLKKHLKSCKDREDYYQILKETPPQTQAQSINNGTINNGTINNINQTINNGNTININVFGQESLGHIQSEKLIQMLRDLSKDYSKKEVYLSAGEFINLVNRYIRDVPENDNFSIPDPKGLYAEIKTETGMERVPIDRYLEKSFKSSAKTILDKKESINEQNDRVFKSETNQSIFSEVKGFAKDGFRHTPSNCIGTPRQVKSSYKVGMLKKNKSNEPIDF